jgi:hypothetical protein
MSHQTWSISSKGKPGKLVTLGYDRQGEARNTGISIRRSLLLYRERLIVPDENYLRRKLIRETPDQVSSAYLGRLKTFKLLSERYHWPNMRATTNQYVSNCHMYNRAMNPRDRKPGFLFPLPFKAQCLVKPSPNPEAPPAIKIVFPATHDGPYSLVVSTGLDC